MRRSPHWLVLMVALAEDLHPEVAGSPSPGRCRRLRAWSPPLDRPLVRAALGITCGLSGATTRCPHRGGAR